MNELSDDRRSFAERWLTRLESRWLLGVAGLLLLINLGLPDPLPLADEIVQLILTVLFARWQTRRRSASAKPPPLSSTSEPGTPV
jgi:hypothetical protein